MGVYRREFLHWMGAGAAAMALPSLASGAGAPRPNIAFILADDLGWKDVGYHGSEIRTPNLDRLAGEGTRLERFYAQPVCSPTRACLMTGRYPMRHGLQVGVVRPWAQYGLPLEERTLAQALKDAGYETAITGKWHLGHCRPEYLPTRRGFDHQYGHYNGALDYFTHIRDGGFDWHRDGKVCRDEGYTTELVGAEAVRLIEGHNTARPLFLYVPFNAPHTPLQAPEAWVRQYEGIEKPNRRKYAAMVACEDDQVGRIAAALRKRGMWENTLFIFCSDNGGPIKQGADNGPLRGAKGTVYEGGVRVPAFAVWPGRLKAGAVVNEPLHMVDWYPTLLGLAGARREQPLPLDGRDAWAAIAEGARTPHEEILHNVTPAGGALRRGDWKLVLHTGRPAGDEGDDGNPAFRPPAPGPERVELFNIARDPNEQEDLSAKEPARVKELRARLDAYAAQAVPPKIRPKAPSFKAPAVWGEFA